MNDVRETAREAGVHVSTWSPGDGVTRYRFFVGPDAERNMYFGPEDGVYTAYGRKEALVWLAGYASGRNGR